MDYFVLFYAFNSYLLSTILARFWALSIKESTKQTNVSVLVLGVVALGIGM